MLKKTMLQIIVVVAGGFILALLVAECREVRQTHDAVIRMEKNK